ncbi:MAG TPA: hypothetical protein VFI13_09625, partial [Gemmatimonadales bacterium]|nr:hypothetical protein [Gemmatimonadales bacterium]
MSLSLLPHLPRVAAALMLTAGTVPPPTPITVRLTEWKVEASTPRAAVGPVRFVITNAGTIPHAFEVEGRGLERETHLLQPGQVDSLTLTLRAGKYELYCPVGAGSHEHLGMVTHLVVGNAAATADRDEDHDGEMSSMASQTITVTGGGPVVQILPGPFPFADSAAAVIAARPADQAEDLRHKVERGPYSNNVAVISGNATFSAWDRGATGDSVSGTAEFTTQDGARWKLVLDRVQTKDIPFNPRFGGAILGLYYHGASGVHTPLVPTIKSAVALWAFGHLYKNDALVTDGAMVHVMLLSRTRRANNF